MIQVTIHEVTESLKAYDSNHKWPESWYKL